MKHYLLIILFALIYLLIAGDKLLRDNIVDNAYEYKWVIPWSPFKDTLHITNINDNTNYIWHSAYTIGGRYYKMPYVYGGFDTEIEFQNIINSSDPAYPAGGYNTDSIYYFGQGYQYNTDNKIGGIDCAGFVYRTWNVNQYLTYEWFIDSTIQVADSFRRKGDVVSMPRHQMLYVAGDTLAMKVYESTSDVQDYHPGVQYTFGKNVSGSHTYTPFPYIVPVFPKSYECLPLKKKAIAVVCSLTSKGSIGNIKMLVNGSWVEHTERNDILNRNIEISYKIHKPEKGIYRIKIYAENTLFGNQYCDTFAYEFYHGIAFDAYRVAEPTRFPIPSVGYVFYDSTFSYAYREGDTILVSGNPLGTQNHWVDDIITVIVKNSYGQENSWYHNYAITNNAITPEPPTDISNLFSEGENIVRVIMNDDENYGSECGCGEIWLSRKGIEEARLITEAISDICGIDEPQLFIETLYNEENVIFLSAGNDELKRLSIYDISGREVFNTEYISERFVWNKCTNNGVNTSRGIFFYTVSNGNEVQSGKILILK